tara:strand:- start:845 stop:1285 length:441 start_codon:yes stop_codon:yes gene_type:complete
MGFGGGSGFNPSRTEVNASTKAGSSLDQYHQFTGSVDITGSLTVNGIAITSGSGGGGTPGGSDTQVQYNDAGSFTGSANLTFDGSTLAIVGGSTATSYFASAGGFLTPQVITTVVAVPANHNGALYGPVKISNEMSIGANSNIKIL